MAKFLTTNTLNVVCAYKYGNGFDVQDVENLYDNVSENLECDFNFICNTDSEYRFRKGIHINRIGMDLEKWWNKMSCFRIHGPCLYLDLDTVILSPLKDLCIKLLSQQFMGYQRRRFWMMDAFNKNRDWASGVMAWTGSFNQLWERFLIDKPDPKLWDQNYTKSKVGNIECINDYANIVSFKHHCNRKTGQAPEDADIVCFHGNPRPRDLKFKVWK